MDSIHEPGVQKIAVVACAQVGKTESLLNMIGYAIEHQPAPILVVPPTFADAERLSKGRLQDMIRTVPELGALVTDRRVPSKDGRAESTVLLKQFPGGSLSLGGANTPNTFAAISVKYAFGDDVDRWPMLNDEGDPSDLLMNRVRTFLEVGGRAIFFSTPTLKGGRIDSMFSRSDQRRYIVPCPRCEVRTWISWNNDQRFRIRFDERDARTARIECPGCKAELREPERARMIAAGRWEATAEAQEPGLVGFHVPAMLSPWVPLTALVGEFLSANSKGRESLRVFLNTMLGEPWEERGSRIEPHSLMSRRESYGDCDVPAPAVCLTAGVDVQADRFEIQVIGWGPAGERWYVDTRTIPGDPKRAETRAAMLEALGARYQHASGHMLPIHATCIDSGYATEEVYDFVLAYQHRRIFATKGVAGKSGEPIVSKASEQRYGRRPRPIRLYRINVDDAKAEVYASLSIVSPGPGFIHFSDRVDEDYFAQLCSEHRETRYNKSGVATHSVWVQDRARNEALDTAVMALAAVRLLNPPIKAMADQLARTPVPGGGGGSPPPLEPSKPPTNQQRRLRRSGYLGR